MLKISRRTVLRGVAVTAAGVALTSGSSVAASAAVAPAAGGTTCTMQTLPVPANTYRSEVAAIDSSGRFILGSAIVREETDTYPVLLWDRGRLTSFDPPAPGGQPVDVNRDGVVVGNGSGFPTSPPWTYRNGVATLLPVIDPADWTTVVAINSRGDIAGMGWTSNGESYGLLWRAARTSTVQVVNTPVGSTISGLTDDGTIVGRTGEAESTAWMRTPSGVVRPLVGPDGDADGYVLAANGHWAVGQGRQAGALVGLRWDLRTGQPTVLDSRLDINPTDVNAHGTVLAGDQLQRGNTVVTLPSPDPSQPVAGRSLADDQTVAGFHNNRLPGGVRAVRWIGC
ncbi:hypothetical protein GCM10022225_50240 [Plantactinospora mayteni]|uniref:Uncharacterized protein n=1 Tax=Plantactinospora mayteni TaxID=566021 RepID=A0ABQ4EY29_9ACTN|nr:hypothetical protein [Plantactinospora mayteni]GIG99522.1 hypothetical protein Pma05_60950 [Plantactinospora mayteni]